MRLRLILLLIIPIFLIYNVTIAQSLPVAFELKEDNFEFTKWSDNSVSGTYPDHMIFKVFDSASVPDSNSTAVADWKCPYNLNKGARFNGSENGILIIPGNEMVEGNLCAAGAVNGRPGEVWLHLNSLERSVKEFSWNIQLTNSTTENRYFIDVWYSLDSGSTWLKLENSTFSSNNKENGAIEEFSVELPEEMDNRASILLKWKCYSEDGIEGATFPSFLLSKVNITSIEFDNGEPELGINEADFQPLYSFFGEALKIEPLKIQGKNLGSKINISVDLPFEISLTTNGFFTNSIEIPTNGGKLDSFIVYVRFRPDSLGKFSKNLFINYANGKRYAKTIVGGSYGRVVINEVLAANQSNLKDNTGSYEDWIEIYNPNEYPVNISSYYVTDNPENKEKYKLRSFSTLLIEPYSFLLLWASDELVRGAQHIAFKLSATEGEHFAIYTPEGGLVSDSISFGQQNTDISYGRKTDGDLPWVLFPTPTPLASNNNSPSNTGVLAPPVFSHKAGYYKESFNLRLSSPDPGAVIVYTTDGSEPDINNLNGTTFLYKKKYPVLIGQQPEPLFVSQPYSSFVYNDPILIEENSSLADKYTNISTMVEAFPDRKFPKLPVRKVNVVRAKCYKNGQISSKTITNTFIIDSNRVYSDKLPLISINTTPTNLFDYDKGIYVPGIDYDKWRIRDTIGGFNGGRPANYTRRGSNAEIQANFELFDDTVAMLNQAVGIRIHGNWSRAARVKSLRIYARDKYGASTMSYPFFYDLPYYNYENIILRNSGGDWFRTYFRDGYAHELIKHHDLEVQAYRPSVVFVNGEYWGLLNIRERQDEDYLSAKYDVEPNKVDIIGPNLGILAGNRVHYDSLLNYIKLSGTASDSNYAYLNTQMDIKNYIDYQASRIYSATLDWPGNNIKFWRYKTQKYEPDAAQGHDGRWRWIFYDADSGFGLDGGAEAYKHNTLLWSFDSLLYINPNATFLMRNMMRNQRFREEFATRFADMLNTTYTPKRAEALYNECKNRIIEEMPLHIQRWGDPVNMNQWNSATAVIRKFVTERQTYIRQHFIDYYQFPGSYLLKLDVSDVSHGYINVNTIKINPKTVGVDSIPYPWEGTYFKTLPVKMTAKNYNGFLFNRWELKDSISYYPEITINPSTDSFYAKAIFIEDTLYRYVPEPFALTQCPFAFTEWKGASEKGTYPDNMIFVYMNYPDPRMSAEIDSFTFGNYNSISKTRINGLSEDGIAFLNSGSDNPGYPASKIGGAIVSVNTQNIEGATISWVGGTVSPGSLVYNIRLQYRIGDQGDFYNFTDEAGNDIEYKRSEIAGHQQKIGPIKIPNRLLGKECVQFFFKYYFTGLKLDEKSNVRDQLRLDDIIIGQVPMDTIIAKAEYETILQANQNGTSYEWFYCDKDSLMLLESDNKYQFNISKAGNYAVAVQYTECIDTSDCFYAFVKEKLGLKTSVSAIISPNPVKDILNVNFPEFVKGGFWATITDMQGRVMMRRFFNEGNSFKINTNGLSAGVYILSLTNENDLDINLKFVRQ